MGLALLACLHFISCALALLASDLDLPARWWHPCCRVRSQHLGDVVGQWIRFLLRIRSLTNTAGRCPGPGSLGLVRARREQSKEVERKEEQQHKNQGGKKGAQEEGTWPRALLTSLNVYQRFFRARAQLPMLLPVVLQLWDRRGKMRAAPRDKGEKVKKTEMEGREVWSRQECKTGPAQQLDTARPAQRAVHSMIEDHPRPHHRRRHHHRPRRKLQIGKATRALNVMWKGKMGMKSDRRRVMKGIWTWILDLRIPLQAWLCHLGTCLRGIALDMQV